MFTYRHSAARTAIAALVTLAATSVPAVADTAVLTPVADATLFEPPFKDLQRASGSGQYLYLGRTSRDRLRRSLLRFDLSSIPAGATITSVTLQVAVTRSFTIAVDAGLYLCTASWGEGASDSGTPGGGGVDPEPLDATWATSFWPDVLWTTPGGDYLPDVRAVASMAEAGTSTLWTSSPLLVADVQSWLDEPATNHGWLVRHVDESLLGFSKQIGSRENEDPALRPTLTVEYTIGGPLCIADFNDDGIVNSTDVSDFINQWFTDLTEGTLVTDWDNNGVVNSTDVSSFINDWFAAPPECTG
jgi:hypothetical protein